MARNFGRRVERQSVTLSASACPFFSDAQADAAKVHFAAGGLTGPDSDKIRAAYCRNDSDELAAFMGLAQTCQELTAREKVRIANSPFLERLTKVADTVQGFRAKVILCEINEAQAVEQMDGILASLSGHSILRIITPSATDPDPPFDAAKRAPPVAGGVGGVPCGWQEKRGQYCHVPGWLLF